MSDEPFQPVEAAARQRSVVIKIIRGAFVALFVVVALLQVIETRLGSSQREVELAIGWQQTLIVAIFLALTVVLVDVLTPTRKISTFAGVFLGLVVGMLATVAAGWVIDLIATSYDIAESRLVATTKVLVGISLCYLAINTVLQTQDDFRLVIPYVEFAKQIRGPKPLVLDSSALIDARIADLAGTGLVQAPIVIPRFIVAELQRLSDSQDRLKRARGRRGLDIVSKLQRSPTLDVTIDDSPVPAKSVDMMLVELARRIPGKIVTTDAGLQRVAGIHGVSVLNVNAVANALKPALVPGEHLRVTLVRQGEQPDQGVGYLDDGTMIVAEHGSSLVGHEADMEVTSSLQTAAGRMIFARVLPNQAPALQGPGNEHAADDHHDAEPARPAYPQPDESHHEPPSALAPGSARTPAEEPESRRTPAAGPFPPKPPVRPSRGRNPRR